VLDPRTVNKQEVQLNVDNVARRNLVDLLVQSHQQSMERKCRHRIYLRKKNYCCDERKPPYLALLVQGSACRISQYGPQEGRLPVHRLAVGDSIPLSCITLKVSICVIIRKSLPLER